MAGQREGNKRLIGRETEEAWLERMSQEGAVAPAENILGVQNALDPKPQQKDSSFLGNLISKYYKFIDEKAIPGIGSFLSGLKPKSAAEEFAKSKRTLSGN